MTESTPHINPNGVKIAKTVLMPGDPLRAQYIAENFLENVEQFNTVRNMLGYTGTYKGKEVSVMGSGMGIPSIGIEWYAKGGILTKPTAFGMNGNSLMVGGEAGKEAVLPLNERNLSAIGRGIAQTMDPQGTVININISDNIIREEADIEKIANKVSQKIAAELRRQKELRGAPAW